MLQRFICISFLFKPPWYNLLEIWLSLFSTIENGKKMKTRQGLSRHKQTRRNSNTDHTQILVRFEKKYFSLKSKAMKIFNFKWPTGTTCIKLTERSLFCEYCIGECLWSFIYLLQCDCLSSNLVTFFLFYPYQIYVVSFKAWMK